MYTYSTFKILINCEQLFFLRSSQEFKAYDIFSFLFDLKETLMFRLFIHPSTNCNIIGTFILITCILHSFIVHNSASFPWQFEYFIDRLPT